MEHPSPKKELSFSPIIHYSNHSRLVKTPQAAEATGMSEWELRRGYKAGIYPAIEIGRGERAKRLRWRLDLLNEAIENEMKRRMEME